MNPSNQDPYMILGLLPSATGKQIIKAYHRLAMNFHPDKNPNDPEAEKKFKEIQRVYERLRKDKRPQAFAPSNDMQGSYFVDSADPFLKFFAAVRCYCLRKTTDN